MKHIAQLTEDSLFALLSSLAAAEKGKPLTRGDRRNVRMVAVAVVTEWVEDKDLGVLDELCAQMLAMEFC